MFQNTHLQVSDHVFVQKIKGSKIFDYHIDIFRYIHQFF